MIREFFEMNKKKKLQRNKDNIKHDGKTCIKLTFPALTHACAAQFIRWAHLMGVSRLCICICRVLHLELYSSSSSSVSPPKINDTQNI